MQRHPTTFSIHSGAGSASVLIGVIRSFSSIPTILDLTLSSQVISTGKLGVGVSLSGSFSGRRDDDVVTISKYLLRWSFPIANHQLTTSICKIVCSWRETIKFFAKTWTSYDFSSRRILVFSDYSDKKQNLMEEICARKNPNKKKWWIFSSNSSLFFAGTSLELIYLLV